MEKVVKLQNEHFHTSVIIFREMRGKFEFHIVGLEEDFLCLGIKSAKFQVYHLLGENQFVALNRENRERVLRKVCKLQEHINVCVILC